MKKIMAVASWILSAGLLLTGCGSSAEYATQEIEQETTIRMAVPYDNPYYETVLTALIEDYMVEHESVRVELEFLPYQNYERTITSMAANGEQADLILVDNAYIPMLVQRGILADIDVWLNRTDLTDKLDADMIPNASDNDNLYGCPFLCWTYELYYDEDKISRDMVTSLVSWQELENYARRSLAAGQKMFAIAASDTEELSYQFQELLLSENANLYTLRVAESSETLKGLAELLSIGAFPIECLDWNQTDLTRKFAQGAVVTMLNRSTQVPFLEKTDPDMNWGVVEMPIQQGKSHIMGIQSIVVAANADTAAYDFLEWLMQKEQVRKVATELNGVAVRTDVRQELEAEGIEGPVRRQSLQYGGSFQSWPVISETMRSGVRNLLMGSRTPMESLRDMQYTISQYYVW